MLLPIKVSHEKEKLAWQFIWGTTNTACKVSIIKWESCYQPVESGGLGIRRLEVQNKSFLYKLCIALLTKENDLWVQVLRYKYRFGNGCPVSTAKPGCLYIWRSLSRVWAQFRSKYLLVTGRCVQFWMDTWVPDVGPLSDLFPGMVAGIEDLRVSNVVDSLGNRRWDFLAVLLDISTFLRITFNPPPGETAGPDRCIWRWTSLGQFSVSTAYKHLVAECFARAVWVKLVPNSLHGAFFSGELSFWLTNKIPNVTHVSLLNVQWEVLFAIVCWRLWKQQNAVVFQQKHRSTEDFVASCWSWAASVHKAADLRL
ncbi:hypothetical protein PVK06_025691 [Gossypium arboreum]|uniref:Reverse transcriptase zinc-binding domain-containing protein n=1 Tax=Gossypium arboreum TaxID=29729 RepID=A0ABR0NVN8_GOSAR|nr:hypothetical protein PVK06_025691 [Gossypium arboreum]